MMKPEELQARYGESQHGNFAIKDTIGVPHPYCIGPKHVEIAADQFSGMLGEDAIIAAERQGVTCCTCRGKLSYEQHEQALLVSCKAPLQIDGATNPELAQWLLRCKPLAEADKFAGFAFVEAATSEVKL